MRYWVDQVVDLTRLYVRGPTGDWKGACEVSEDGLQYRHMPRWPDSTAASREAQAFGTVGGLQALVAAGMWVPYIDPDLAVSEGL